MVSDLRLLTLVETTGDGALEEGAEGAGECGNDDVALEVGLCGILLRQFPETPECKDYRCRCPREYCPPGHYSPVNIVPPDIIHQ